MTSDCLLEHEKVVLNVVIEYLNQNRYLDLKKIIPFISSRFKASSLGFNSEGIRKIINITRVV